MDRTFFEELDLTRTWVWSTILICQSLIGISVLLLDFPLNLIWLALLIPVVIFQKPIIGYWVMLPLLPNYGIDLLNIYASADLSPLEVGVFFAGLSWIVMCVKKRRVRVRLGEGAYLLFFLYIWVACSYFWTPSKVIGIQQLIKILIALMIYCMPMLFIENKDDLRHTLFVWLIMGYVVSVIGIHEMFAEGLQAAKSYTIPSSQYMKIHKDVRLTAIFEGADMMGFLMAIQVIFSLMICYTEKGFWRFVAFLAFPLFLVNLLGTMSRKSYLSLAVAGAFFLWRTKKIGNVLLIGIPAVCLFFTAIVMVGDQQFLSAMWLRARSMFMDPDIAISARVGTWKVGWDIFHFSPLTGSGIGSFRIYAAAVGSPLFFPHNFYLSIACELGLIGLLLAASWAFFVLCTFIKALKMNDDPQTAILANGFMTIFVIVAVQACFRSFSLTDPTFWSAAGLSMAFLRVYGLVYSKRAIEERVLAAA